MQKAQQIRLQGHKFSFQIVSIFVFHIDLEKFLEKIEWCHNPQKQTKTAKADTTAHLLFKNFCQTQAPKQI